MNTGKAIKKFQTEQSISCNELSAMLGVVPQQLSRWRKSQDLKLSIVLSFCEIFKIKIDEFILAGQ